MGGRWDSIPLACKGKMAAGGFFEAWGWGFILTAEPQRLRSDAQLWSVKIIRLRQEL